MAIPCLPEENSDLGRSVEYILPLNVTVSGPVIKTYTVYGDPNHNLEFVLAITLKVYISDPMLVQPKCL